MAYITILRPVNCIIAFLSVIIGFVVSQGPGVFILKSNPKIFFAALSAFFIAGFGNVINDIVDSRSDMINHPERPIPSGKITNNKAIIYNIFLLLAGFAFARLVSTVFLILCVLITLLLSLYSFELKKTVLIGNLTIAFLTGFTLIYGGILSMCWIYSAIPAFFAFIINLSREIVKDVSDIEGDKESNAETMPVKFGISFSLKVSGIFLSILIVGSILPYIYGVYNKAYLLIVLVGVDIPLLYVISKLFTINKASKKIALLSSILKIIMFMGMVAIVLGGNVCGRLFNA